MRKTFKKILIILLIILTLNNFLLNSVYADTNPEMQDEDEEFFSNFFGSVIGLFTWPIRIVALAASSAVNLLVAGVAYVEGTTDPNDDTINTSVITPFDIFFNKVAILDINFFDFKSISEDSLVYKIRTGIASWYYILRIVASSILLVVLIYVGIRMAISTIATDKAMYKKMLIDWICSLAIIFLIHYVIIFTITISNALVNSVALSVDSKMINDTFRYIQQLGYHIIDLESIPATVIFCMLVWQTFGLVITYFNRMLKLAFLVIISPLITLTYSIDKMGDGKAQALSGWLKEFVYTVLIQPVHCIIYMCFIDIAFSLLIEKQGNGVSRETIAVAIISIICVKFVKDAEMLVRKIFHFEDDGSSSLGTGLAIASVALGKARGIGKGARSTINSARNLAGNVAATAQGMKIGALALGRRWGTSEGRKKTYAEAKEDVRTNINNKKAEKIGNKYIAKNKALEGKAEEIRKDYASKGEKISRSKALMLARDEKIKGELSERTQEIKNAYGGYMSDDEAKSIARLQIAKEKRTENSKPRKMISGAKGKINSFRSAVGQSEALKAIGTLGKGYMSAGLGLAVGSGVIGTKGSFLTGAMAGAAMYKGSQSFMNSSSKTIANNINQNFKALKANSPAEMSTMAAGIVDLFSNEDKANEELNKIMDELEKALEHAGFEGKRKTNIKNTIEGGIKADPSKTNDIMRMALKGAGIEMSDAKNPTIGNIVKATQKLADFTNKSQIYQSLQTAGDIGLEMDTILGEAMSRFVPNNTSSETESLNFEYENSAEIVTDSVLDADNYNTNIELAERETIITNKKELDEYRGELEREKEETLKEMRDNGAEQIDIDEMKKDIERANTDIIARMISNLERQYEIVDEQMKAEIQLECNKIIQEIENEKASGEISNSKIKLLDAQKNSLVEARKRL